MKNKLATLGLAGILLLSGCATTKQNIKTASEGIDRPATVATDTVKNPDEIVNEYDSAVKDLFNQYAPKSEETPTPTPTYNRVPPEGL